MFLLASSVLAVLNALAAEGSVSLVGPLVKNRDNFDEGADASLISFMEGIELDKSSNVSVGQMSEARLGSKVVLKNSVIRLSDFSSLYIFRHDKFYPTALDMENSQFVSNGRYAHIRIKWIVKMRDSHIRMPGVLVNEVGIPVGRALTDLMKDPDHKLLETASGAKLFIGGKVNMTKGGVEMAQASKAHVFGNGAFDGHDVSIGAHGGLLLSTNASKHRSFYVGGDVHIGERANMLINNTGTFSIQDQGSVVVGNFASFIVNATELKISQPLILEEGSTFIIKSHTSLICYVGDKIVIKAGTTVVVSEAKDPDAPAGLDCNVRMIRSKFLSNE